MIMMRNDIAQPYFVLLATLLCGFGAGLACAQQDPVKRFEQLERNRNETNTPDEVKQSSVGASKSPVRQGPELLAPGEHGIGRYVRDFEFRDLEGGLKWIHQDPPSDLTVIAFTSTSCPISKKYLPTLVELQRDFAPRGVRFVLVNCVASDKPEEMKIAASRFEFPVEYALDTDARLASHLSAMSTTDVFVVDRSYTLIYRGAIDDQYGFGYSIDTPRHTYLRDAVQAGLDHRSALVSATAAPGCALETRTTSAPVSEVTYHNHVSRLLQRHCVECHREGGVGPFRLDTYPDAVAHGAMIRQVVESGIMPPWFAAPAENKSQSYASTWINDRSLSATEKQLMIAWLDNKMPEGDPNESPLPMVFNDGWTIGKPDAVFEFDQPMKVKATGTMPYQNITVDTHLEQDQWVQAIEIRPGNLSVVHHVLVFVQGSDEEDGARDEAADERGGYWGIYVPGNSKLVYPAGYARRIPKGAKLRFQMHYTPNGTATEDSTRIGLVFAKEEPKHEVHVASVVNMRFRIPAGADNHPVVGSIKSVPVDVQILAFLPHMHLRGKAARYELISGGKTQTLLDVPRYDFNWQLLYRYAEPLSIKAGDALQYTAWYDNSSGNPANPDPSKEVRWGPQTFDEMHLGYVEYIVPGAKPGEPNPLSPRNRIRGAVRNAFGRGESSGPNLGDGLFQQLDTDGDGNVTRDEVKAKFANNPAASTTIFDRLDADKNGQLNRQELRKLSEILGR